MNVLKGALTELNKMHNFEEYSKEEKTNNMKERNKYHGKQGKRRKIQ